MTKWVIGNWKMHGGSSMASDLVTALTASSCALDHVAICPPYPLLASLAQLCKTSELSLGAQRCHHETHGAFTGQVSADLIRASGCTLTLAGHSECREYLGDDSATVAAQASAAHHKNLTAVICIGESRETYEQGQTKDFLAQQLRDSLPASANGSNTLIAYEPIWAIGTGLTPTLEEIDQLHLFLKQQLSAYNQDIPLLYGGSVKADNAPDILRLKHVDGVLVGGASLKADDFLTIIHAAQD